MMAHEVSNGVATVPTRDEVLALYRQMTVIRRVEEHLAKAYFSGAIPGACHTYVGQEAVATGVCAHLRNDDAVFSTHRGHGYARAKGCSRGRAARLMDQWCIA